jgi:hypothetical protein
LFLFFCGHRSLYMQCTCHQNPQHGHGKTLDIGLRSSAPDHRVIAFIAFRVLDAPLCTVIASV